MSSPIRPPAAPDLRVAIVGSGLMATRHASAISRAMPGARVVAFADPEPPARETFQQICPEATPYPSLTTLLASETVDVVHICTPPPSHENLAIEALEAGCHVYVEKPFAETLAGAQRVVEVSKRCERSVCAGHQLLFEAPARRTAELLPALGEVVHIESYFAFRPARISGRSRKPLRLDLQLLDVLPHPVYLLIYFLEAAHPEGETRIVACEIGPKGTAHLLIRRGGLSTSLVISLDGRPVESYLRIVGQNGALYADFVRGSVQHLIGPGSSLIDKMLNPYRQAAQLIIGTTRSLLRRATRRQVNYPGLAEILEAFYHSIRSKEASPVSPDNILSTVKLCEEVANRLGRLARRRVDSSCANVPVVLVTGGTGFLGQQLTRELLARRLGVRVLARREPALWDRIDGVEYATADLGANIPDGAVVRADVVIHLAAETVGGFEEHRRNSVDATERILRAAASAGVNQFIHVSSVAVHASGGGGSPIHEDSPLEPNSRERGPYVWGKVESERLASRLGPELGIDVKIVRPGAIIDFDAFQPPGRLGKRIGNLFLAVGPPSAPFGAVSRKFAAEALAWGAANFDAMSPTVNLLAPVLPTRRELVWCLRRSNPGIRVLWLPRWGLAAISRSAVLLQRALRPNQVPVDLDKVFGTDTYDTACSRLLASQIASANPTPRRDDENVLPGSP